MKKVKIYSYNVNINEKGREEARDILKYHLKPYEMVKRSFVPNNMTEEEFDKYCKAMEEGI